MPDGINSERLSCDLNKILKLDFIFNFSITITGVAQGGKLFAHLVNLFCPPSKLNLPIAQKNPQKDGYKSY